MCVFVCINCDGLPVVTGIVAYSSSWLDCRLLYNTYYTMDIELQIGVCLKLENMLVCSFVCIVYVSPSVAILTGENLTHNWEWWQLSFN